MIEQRFAIVTFDMSFSDLVILLARDPWFRGCGRETHHHTEKRRGNLTWLPRAAEVESIFW
jgi:hypothetical protein